MARKVDYQAPFTQDGHLMHYPQDRYTGTYVDAVYVPGPVIGPDWRPIEPFDATLTISDMHRGRSAAYFECVDGDGHKFPMFMTDLLDVIRTMDVRRGTVAGRWVVGKRGQNYGIRLAAVEGGASHAA
jgi:hypothetical protein